MNQKGIAMVAAIVLALVVSVIAAGVLSLTMRRFELSSFRTDHAVAAATSEAGFQYAFARLAADPAFRAAVELKRTNQGVPAISRDNVGIEYLVCCHNSPTWAEDEVLQNDLTLPSPLHMGGVMQGGQLVGGKHVMIRIRFFTAADIAAGEHPAAMADRPYRVRSFSAFGSGEEWGAFE